MTTVDETIVDELQARVMEAILFCAHEGNLVLGFFLLGFQAAPPCS